MIERRIRKAYPKAVKTESVKKDAGGVFASGCCFYKIMLLFIIGAFLGDITETIFCRITEGVWHLSHCFYTNTRTGVKVFCF